MKYKFKELQIGEVWLIQTFVNKITKAVAYIQYVISVDDGILYIQHLFVDDEHRHKGIGTKLVIKALEHAYGNNIKIVNVDSMTRNEPNQNLFYKIGFEYVDRANGPEMIGNIEVILSNIN